MKPVLIVEGIRKNVVSLNYRDGEVSDVMASDEHGNLQTYYDEKQALYVEKPLKVNMQDALIWENRYSPISEAIHKRINAHEEKQIDLAQQFIESESPFSDGNLQKEYQSLSQVVEGLTESLGIIKEIETGQTFEERTEIFARNVTEALKKWGVVKNA